MRPHEGQGLHARGQEPGLRGSYIPAQGGTWQRRAWRDMDQLGTAGSEVTRVGLTYCDQLPEDLGATTVSAAAQSSRCRFLKIKCFQEK